MVQVIEHLPGRTGIGFLEDLFFEKLPCYLLHEFDYEGIVGGNPFDFL
jgi:hypothetical protein